MDVDGTDNARVEIEAAPVPAGPENADGGAFVSDRRVLASESRRARTSRR